MSEIVARFARVCRDTPRRCLLHLPSARVSLTAETIWQASLDQKRRLEIAGLGPDDLLLCAAGNHAAVVPLWLACRSLHVPILPVDAGTTPAEIDALARRFGARVALLSSRLALSPAFARAEAYVDGLAIARMPGVQAQPHIYRGAAALKLTSGSTGLPKATFTTERQLLLDTEHIAEAMQIGSDDTQLASIPLSHAYGLGNLVVPLLIQGTPIVLRDGFVPHQFASDARAFEIRTFPGVPFMFDHLAGHWHRGTWPPSLRLLVSAGARLEPPLVHRFHRACGAKIHSFYGTSETGGIAYDDTPGVDPEPGVGRPLPGVRVALRPQEEARADEGRVHVAGDAIASGYAGEERGDEGFTGDGFLTGDVGRFDARGHLVLTGRASAFINVAGRKVQPEEVEEVLRAIPGVADVRVLGAPDPVRGQQVVACIVAAWDPDVLAIRRFCGARLAPYKIPRCLVRLDRIPLTERGKTDRRRLDEIVRAHLERRAEAGML